MIEVLKQALEALEFFNETAICSADTGISNEAITSLRQAIAELESQEPFTYYRHYDGGTQEWPDERTIPLYTHPPQRTEQEPFAWVHNFIDGGISIGKRPSDLDRHPDRWTALYKEPKPCPTCEALARTVMLDQTSHDTHPPQD